MRRVARATSRACDEPPHERHRRRHCTSSCRRAVAPHARPGPGESLPWCEERVPRRRRRVRRHRRRPELQRKGNIEHSRQHTSNYYDQAPRRVHARVRGLSLRTSLCRQSLLLFLCCALPLADNLTRRTLTSPAMSRLTFTHPLVFAYSCFHPRSHSSSLALSHKEEAEMASKVTSQGSRATRNRSQRTVQTQKLVGIPTKVL